MFEVVRVDADWKIEQCLWADWLNEFINKSNKISQEDMAYLNDYINVVAVCFDTEFE